MLSLCSPLHCLHSFPRQPHLHYHHLHHYSLHSSSPLSLHSTLITPSSSLRRRLPLMPPIAADSLRHDSQLSPPHQASTTGDLKIAIIGFGNFGQFLAQTLVRQGHTVLAHSRSDYSTIAQSLGVTFFRNPDDLCEEHPDVILLCTSILSAERVLLSLPLHRFKRNTLFVDVLSVKEFPRNLFLRTLPVDFDILCTHPMFGPESAREGWGGLTFVYDKVRIGSEESRISRCERFLDVFANEGCRMVEMSSAEHDKSAAGSQFITLTIGRVLEKLKLEATPIGTKGYESLLNLVEYGSGDSFDLYYGLFMYNKNALEQLERLDLAFQSLRKLLFGNLHEVLRKQLFGNVAKLQYFVDNSVPSNLSQNGVATTSHSETLRADNASQQYILEKPTISSHDKTSSLKIAIVGFGNYGQFLAKTFVRQGHTVFAYSRSNYSDVAQKIGVSFFCDTDDLCEEHPEIVLLCTSVISTEQVIKSLPFQRLKRSTLFVDVLSVKEFPRNLLLQHLPPCFDILCTHPMFGPESGRHGWKGLPLVFDKVRVGKNETRVLRCERFLDIFAQEGCRMVEMTCSEHDRHAAGSQFITHTVGRVLEKLSLESTPINTRGYESLLNLVDNTAADSFDLYYGLFMYNTNAMEQIERLDLAFESLKKKLLGQLHGIVRMQLFEGAHPLQVSQDRIVSPTLNQEENAKSANPEASRACNL